MGTAINADISTATHRTQGTRELSKMSYSYAEVVENPMDHHDEVVLKARGLAERIAHDCGFAATWPINHMHHALHVGGEGPVTTELEYEITPTDYADLAVFWDGGPKFLMEVKSKNEIQSASGWSRQVKRYERTAGLPCVLVIAHDLGSLQRRYLEAADIHVVDLRRFDK